MLVPLLASLAWSLRLRPTFYWVIPCAALALASCTSITEVKEIDCERIEFFPPDATAATADSAIYRNCDPPEFSNQVVRFAP
jgi:hypothetical protein